MAPSSDIIRRSKDVMAASMIIIRALTSSTSGTITEGGTTTRAEAVGLMVVVAASSMEEPVVVVGLVVNLGECIGDMALKCSFCILGISRSSATTTMAMDPVREKTTSGDLWGEM